MICCTSGLYTIYSLTGWVEIVKGPHWGRSSSWLTSWQVDSGMLPLLNNALPEISTMETSYCVKSVRLQLFNVVKQISLVVTFTEILADAFATKVYIYMKLNSTVIILYLTDLPFNSKDLKYSLAAYTGVDVQSSRFSEKSSNLEPFSSLDMFPKHNVCELPKGLLQRRKNEISPLSLNLLHVIGE